MINYIFIGFREEHIYYREPPAKITTTLFWRRSSSTAGVGYTNSTLAVF